ncbi:smad nuclear-interacting protein 1 [Cryptococcus gattii Ru294]|nr:smad nuclear-interacting protein 1 [Cryptococcus gattii Ru294]
MTLAPHDAIATAQATTAVVLLTDQIQAGHPDHETKDGAIGIRSGNGKRISSRRDRDGSYGEKERDIERAKDRKRYDDDVKKESGLLAKETNTVKGVVVKYNEPAEARKPTKNWRLYVFKGTEQIDLIHIYRQSCYLIGRDEVVTDIPIAHPSCSKQHAAIQYRQMTERNEYGDVATTIKPFIIDLESTNGTFVNDIEVPKSRYYELRASDVIKFGTSSREYVLLHEDVSS